MSTAFHDLVVADAQGHSVALGRYAGSVVLVVNTASECGFTPQLAALEALWREFGPRGLVVLGFPCNQFGAQEPGSDAAIQAFCSTRYDVTFPVLAKVAVKGPQANPLFQWLSAQAPGWLGSRAIKWNFTKFLVGRDGRVQRRYAPATPPARLRADIEAALAAPAPAA